jgi:hypothetical protein
MTQDRLATRFAAAAVVLAVVAALVGLLAAVYRDVPAMVDQAHAADLATLFLAVPAAVAGLWVAGRKTGPAAGRARLVVAGSLGYLVYTYAIYAFQVVVSPVTPLHIAILGLATWSLLLQLPALVAGTEGVGDRLPRRVTAGFLAVVAALFAALWLGQIASAIVTGELPAAVADLALPTSAVYTLDLAFALPLLALAAGLLIRRPARGFPLALAGLVFSVQMAASVVAIFAIQATRGELADVSVPIVFAAIAISAAALAARGLVPAGPSRTLAAQGAA